MGSLGLRLLALQEWDPNRTPIIHPAAIRGAEQASDSIPPATRTIRNELPSAKKIRESLRYPTALKAILWAQP